MKTTSLELSKQLKEAGFPQATYLYHVQYSDDPQTGRSTVKRYSDLSIEYQHPDEEHDKRIFACPTAEEVLERLPYFLLVPIDGQTWNLELNIIKGRDYYRISYGQEARTSFPITGLANEPLANSLARMWLHLKEKGYAE